MERGREKAGRAGSDHVSVEMGLLCVVSSLLEWPKRIYTGNQRSRTDPASCRASQDTRPCASWCKMNAAESVMLFGEG